VTNTGSIIITGGGTAGHTNPGIAIAQALVRAGVPVEDVHFVGGERGNEGTLVPAAGFSIDLLPGRGIQRKLTLQNLTSVSALLRGLWEARRIVAKRQPAVVVCLGGYAAAGTSLAAVIARIPVVVSEQNARASAVNRLIGRFAKVCTLPYPDTDLPNGVLIGNPILTSATETMRNTERDAARRALGLPVDRCVVAVWSGSLGARRVNDAARGLASLWADRGDVALYHVVGRRDWDDFCDHPPALAEAALSYNTVEYEDRMPLLLAAADIAVCRAGASTTAELAVAGLPSILVPLPGAPRDHQTANSDELVSVGGAIRVADAELDTTRLDQILQPLLAQPDQLATMANAAASVGRPDAGDAAAAIVIDVGGISTLGTGSMNGRG
jgi:UDP-N-acetylglucosamine--N-acetylmuramyl-(pentapeptide) pyrophosphoryl-undecaprenol N-acetylglucosamine transferase